MLKFKINNYNYEINIESFENNQIDNEYNINVNGNIIDNKDLILNFLKFQIRDIFYLQISDENNNLIYNFSQKNIVKNYSLNFNNNSFSISFTLILKKE